MAEWRRPPRKVRSAVHASPAAPPARRARLLPQRRGRPRLPGGLAAHPRAADRGRSLFDRGDRGRVHDRPRPGQPSGRGRQHARLAPRARWPSSRPASSAIAAFGALSCRCTTTGCTSAGDGSSPSPLRAGAPPVREPRPADDPDGDVAARSSTRAMVRDAETASRTIGFLYGDQRARRGGGSAGDAVGLHPPSRDSSRGPGRGGREPHRRRGRARPGPVGTEGQIGAAHGGGPARRPPGHGARARRAPRPFRMWLALYALSGFCALALEILWFRVMDVAVKSTAYTFGTLLAVYLLGSAHGGAGRDRARPPAAAAAARVPRPASACCSLYAGGVIALLDARSRHHAVLPVVLRALGRVALVQPRRRDVLGLAR